ncbi:MAG: hypothetical protein WB988_02270 [Candidatus Nitrosopolaris sp.]
MSPDADSLLWITTFGKMIPLRIQNRPERRKIAKKEYLRELA